MANTDRTPICPYADTAENLELRNDILLQGQKVYDITNKKYKTGDGEHAWTELSYDASGNNNEVTETLVVHIGGTIESTSHTCEEIIEAYNEGKVVLGIYNGISLLCTKYDDIGIVFSGVVEVNYDLQQMELMTVLIEREEFGLVLVHNLTFSLKDILNGIEDKANKATTLEGYGIIDAYTKTEIDSSVAWMINSKAPYCVNIIESSNGVITCSSSYDDIFGAIEGTNTIYLLYNNQNGDHLTRKIVPNAWTNSLEGEVYFEYFYNKEWKKITISSSDEITVE